MAANLAQEDVAPVQHSCEAAYQDDDNMSHDGDEISQHDSSGLERWLRAGGRAALVADIATVNRFGYRAR